MTSIGTQKGKHLAFTLTEMLVVIAIIGILAGIVLGALPAVTEKRTRSKVQAELRMLTTAIEAYKEKHGFYPPDNTNNIAAPPLFYELVGATFQNGSYFPLDGTTPAVREQDLSDTFGVDGVLNSSAEASEVKSFAKTLRTNAQFVVTPYVNPFDEKGPVVLRVPAKGPKNTLFPAAEELNTWRYIVTKPGRKDSDKSPYPTNNPNTFDLWADVAIGGKIITIGNWRK
jgi:prepilin-type N-terminal cleavage/methylation domain-containing protein